MPTDDLDVLVVVPDERGAPAPGHLAARTTRAIARAGGHAEVVRVPDLAARLAHASRPTWLLRAGAIPEGIPRRPPASATGRTLLALGATRGAGSAMLDERWSALLGETGGDLARAKDLAARLPPLDSVLVLEPHRLAARLEGDLDAAYLALAAHPATRLVRLPLLDVTRDARLHVLEVVTTLHRGGAERVVVDLVEALRAQDVLVTLAILDHASRATLDAPEGTVDLAAADPGAGRAARIDALAELARRAAVDLVHVHLADGAEVRKLAAAVDVPVVLTLHNDRPGWAARTGELGPEDVAAVFACSEDVARAFVAAAPSVATRTRVAWNGIRGERPVGARARAGALRAELGVPREAPLIVTVANHRPQKRLELVPSVVAALASRGVVAHAALVGEPVSRDPVAREVASRVVAEAESRRLADRVHLAGTREDAAELIAEADVVLSTSAFEGLSLVHLEAMRARRPLVAAAVSGTREIAAHHDGVWRIEDGDGVVERLASGIAEALAPDAPRPGGLAAPFTAAAMGARHVELLASVAARPSRSGGLVLVANNFATGGAQSSARRLLVALQAAGVPVAACVLEEQAGWPTAGRAALEDAGIPVFVAPRAGAVDPAVTADAVARFVHARAPASVVFWNAITQHKVLVAERVLGAAVWDVSPGEMYFASLDRYLEKPRAGHPVRDARAYGRLLTGAVVKYASERALAEATLGVPVHVVPNGVLVPAARRARPPRAGRVVVGTLARINPDKKIGELVRAVGRAVARHPELARTLDVRIAGPVERGCEAHADELRALAEGLPVTFVGEHDAGTFLDALDLFAMVSEPSGCPNASLEAMAAGLAVVATDVGGTREQIQHGETGLLVPRGDADALGDALARLSLDGTAREAMGAAAHARAKDAFALERMVARYRALFLG